MSYILIYLSSLRQNWKTKTILIFLLIIQIISGVVYTDLAFNLINIFLLIIIPLITQCIKKFNEFICLLSIPIYSICIDTICFFLYPQYCNDISLLQYIYNGLAFNFKGLIISMSVCLGVSILMYVRRIKYESKISCSR